MKMIRIDNLIHAQLKKEARERGVLLTWWIEQKLMGPIQNISRNKIPEKSVASQHYDEPTVLQGDQEWEQAQTFNRVSTFMGNKPTLDDLMSSGIVQRGTK